MEPKVGQVIRVGDRRQTVQLVSRIEKWRWNCEDCGASRDTYTTGHGAHAGSQRHAQECPAAPAQPLGEQDE